MRTSAGDLARALDAARRRIQLRPLEEIGYRTMIELQGDLGDRAGAVSTYHHCASVLERELGVEPDPATRAALDRLLTAAAAAPAPPTADGRRRPGPASAALIGRTAEFDTLHAVWQRAAAGRPSVALVHGDAGVGKTQAGHRTRRRRRAAGRGGGDRALLRRIGTPGSRARGGLAARRAGAVGARPARPGMAHRGGTARPDRRGAQRVHRHRARHGRRVATAPVLRGPGAGAVGGRPSAVTGARQRAVVRPGNAWPSSPSASGCAPTCRSCSPERCATTTTRSHSTSGSRGCARAVRSPTSTCTLSIPPTPPGSPRPSRPPRSTAADAALLHATTGGFPLHVVEAARGMGERNGDLLPSGDLGVVLDTRLAHLTPAARELVGLAAAVGRGLLTRPDHRGERSGTRRRGARRRRVVALSHPA